MRATHLKTAFLPQTITVSDLQRKAKTILADAGQRDLPTIVFNRNKQVGVLLNPRIYAELMEIYEDYLDGWELAKSVSQTARKSFKPWSRVKADLKKQGSLV